MLQTEHKFQNLGKRILSLEEGRYAITVTVPPRGEPTYHFDDEEGVEWVEPVKLKQTAIEDALNGLRIGRHELRVCVTPHRMAIEAERLGPIEQ